MRVEDIASHYQGQHRSGMGARGALRKPGTAGRPHSRGIVIDMIDLSVAGSSSHSDIQWLAAYIGRIPDDIIDEKTRSALDYSGPRDMYIINKLLLETL
ncbi:MAG: hypothetical protein GF350_10520 [Chitinivibrionales bacterium]|nr:hypothetical protein [Chitinivibrionales bacterium]